MRNELLEYKTYLELFEIECLIDDFFKGNKSPTIILGSFFSQENKYL